MPAQLAHKPGLIHSTDYDDISDEDGSRDTAGGIGDYAIFLRREMPPLVRRELEHMFQTEFRDVEDRIRPRIEQMVLSLQARLLKLYQESATADQGVSEQGRQSQQAEFSQGWSLHEAVDTQDQVDTPGILYGESEAFGHEWALALSPADLETGLDLGFANDLDFQKLLDPGLLNPELGHMDLDISH